MSPIRSQKHRKLRYTPRMSMIHKGPKAIRQGPGRGRKSKFNDAQLAWIIRTEPTYDRKVAPFNGRDEDDCDLKTWVDTHWALFAEDFESDFANSSFRLEEREKTFRDRYKNRRNNFLKKKAALADDDGEYCNGIQREYRRLVAVHRDEKDKKENALKWDELTQDEKDEWHRIAKTHEVDKVFENQAKFHPMLKDLITRSQGFEAHQSGDSAHLLISTFRDREGVLQNHMLVIEGKHSRAKELLKMFPNFTTGLTSKWNAYVEQAIPDTLSERHALEMTKLKPPPPLLKEAGSIEEEDNLTPAAVRVMLEEYFINLWAYAQGDSSRAIPWDNIVKNPQAFIRTALLPPTIGFNNPHRMERNHLHPLRSLILEHQKHFPLEPFILFLDVSVSNLADAGAAVPDNLSLIPTPQEDIKVISHSTSSQEHMAVVDVRDGLGAQADADGGLGSQKSQPDDSRIVKLEDVPNTDVFTSLLSEHISVDTLITGPCTRQSAVFKVQSPGFAFTSTDMKECEDEKPLLKQSPVQSTSESASARPKKRSASPGLATNKGLPGPYTRGDGRSGAGANVGLNKRARRMTEKALNSGLWNHASGDSKKVLA